MSQVDRFVALDPDVVLSADLLANDSDGAVTSVDLAPVLAADPLSPANLRAAGINCPLYSF